MRYIGWVTSILILVVFGLYYYQFGGSSTTLSEDKEIWGQFGDYFGGVLNPILSFISILLLIKSVKMQLTANECLINETKRQEFLDKRKSFEFQFYNLINAQKSAFDDFSLIFPSPSGDFEVKKVNAVNKLEQLIKTSIQRGIAEDALIKIIESLDDKSDDKMFSFARRFYLAVKLVDNEVITENGFDEQDKHMYIETLINLSDFAMVRLICIIIAYLSWPNVVYLKKSPEVMGVIKSTGLNTYINSLK
ncbi:hypothetical protein [Escherichia coli]|uniref:hypothetical protein n=1 Tax=Escherichia coli TaxID=562 RepID=UPI001658E6C6|nr:hypothetical protein [Escherichia coli]EJB4434142.1 hypothetical protein [Escherichia coli]MBC9304867.1 hypothetical protein [Escherichia coli]MCD9204399.1 hypothetical protein [Escherichia coli]MED0225504.1 hypothetical protein [Escherichia coli]HAV8781101.1 hypothetical protein [Escherichia coli]